MTFGLVGGEIPPHKTHIHARKAHARRERRGGDRVDVPLEQVDRALLTPERDSSATRKWLCYALAPALLGYRPIP